MFGSEGEMSATSVSKDEIIGRLFTVFQERGFEGASLTDLSRATGLGKSSLYHHFPDGKSQMAESVLQGAAKLIDSEIAGIAQSSLSLKARVRKIVSTLDQMYSGGYALCVLGRLATSSFRMEAQTELREVFKAWIGAIARLAEDSGMSQSKAYEFAEDWVARLQGSLILQAATAEKHAFDRTLNALLELAD